MNISVYAGERHERSQRRWLCVYVIFAILFVLTFFGPMIARGGDGKVFSWMNLSNFLIVGAVLGGYIFRIKRYDHMTIMLSTNEESLMIGNEPVDRYELSGFVIEADRESGRLKNIVFVGKGKKNRIHSLHENQSDDVVGFLENVEKYIPHLAGFKQSFLEIVMRKLKL